MTDFKFEQKREVLRIGLDEIEPWNGAEVDRVEREAMLRAAYHTAVASGRGSGLTGDTFVMCERMENGDIEVIVAKIAYRTTIKRGA